MRLPVCFTLTIFGVLLLCCISESRSIDSSKSLEILLKVLLGKGEEGDLSDGDAAGNVDKTIRSTLATLQQHVAELASNMSTMENILGALQQIQDMAEDSSTVQEDILEYLGISGQHNLLEWVSKTIWEPMSAGPVVGGSEDDGQPLYVCRASHQDSFIPGRLQASMRRCYVPWGGSEHIYDDFEVLTNPNNVTLTWVETDAATVPTGAVEGGTSRGRPLYIGRNEVAPNYIAPGKVFPPNGKCYSSYGGLELEFAACEVLVIESDRVP